MVDYKSKVLDVDKVYKVLDELDLTYPELVKLFKEASYVSIDYLKDDSSNYDQSIQLYHKMREVVSLYCQSFCGQEFDKNYLKSKGL